MLPEHALRVLSDTHDLLLSLVPRRSHGLAPGASDDSGGPTRIGGRARGKSSSTARATAAVVLWTAWGSASGSAELIRIVGIRVRAVRLVGWAGRDGRGCEGVVVGGCR